MIPADWLSASVRDLATATRKYVFNAAHDLRRRYRPEMI
jgi:hypothetical protein